MSHFDPQTSDEIAKRLADLKTKLAARAPGGVALPNYGENVAALRTEIARLEAANQPE